MNADSAEKLKRWLPALLCALAGAAGFQCFGNATRGYIDSGSLFYWWFHQWVNPQSETEHGLIILALAVWLVARNLRAAPGGNRSSGAEWGAGVVAMIAGLGLAVVAFAAQQTRLSIVGLLFFSWGVLRFGGGKTWGRAAAFPLAFMVFAIPFNALDSVGFWLRLWVIKASNGLAHLAGIGVVQNGTQLLAPDGRYQYDVAAACSGIRSLMALLSLAVLMGYLNFRTWWRRVALFLLCFPLIYLGNVARISSIIFVAQWRGQLWGERAHDVMGYGVFVIVLGGLMFAASFIQKRWPESSAGGPPAPESEAGIRDSEFEVRARSTGSGSATGGPPALLWGAASGVVMLALASFLFLGHLSSLPPKGTAGIRLSSDGQNPVDLPSFLGTEWIGRRTEVSAIEREILPPDTGYARKDYTSVANATEHVFLSVVLSGRDRTSIHRPELCLVGQGWTIADTGRREFSYPGQPPANFPVTLLRVRREVQTPRGIVVVPQLVAYWFINGDTVIASHWERLMVDAWNRVAHGRADRWAYVLVQTDARDGEVAALARIQHLLDQTLPAFVLPETVRRR